MCSGNVAAGKDVRGRECRRGFDALQQQDVVFRRDEEDAGERCIVSTEQRLRVEWKPTLRWVWGLV